MIDTHREEVQQRAVQMCLASSVDNIMRCTAEMITGIGKTFVAFWLIHYLNPQTVLFLAETSLREKTIWDDAKLFKKYYKIDIFKGRKIQFYCYQSAYRFTDTYYDMVVADEIHDSLSPEYFKYYLNNRYTHLLGLSATVDKKTVYKDQNEKEYKKIDLLNQIAPIAFTYTVKEGQEDNTARKLSIYAIKHYLDPKNKIVPVEYTDKKTKEKKVFHNTEEEYYKYCNSRFVQAMYMEPRQEFIVNYWMRRRNELLYNLKSKTEACRLLLENLDRTIVFGNSITELESIAPTVSSRNVKDENTRIIDYFNRGKIHTIASFKMLKQGMNLIGLDNVVMHSYYSKTKDYIQRSGEVCPYLLNSVNPKSYDMGIPSQAGCKAGRV